jgi:exosortase A-associated hydrolase 1
MGDSGGPSIDFESASNDIAAAVQALFTYCPELRSAVLWGLCDGASASLIYAPTDQRVRGLVLLNPWVRSEAGLAQTHLKNYYGHRFKSAAFWRKMAREPASLFSSAAGYLSDFFAARGAVDASTGSFLERMLSAKGAFSGRTALLLSGNDLTAGEFKALLNRNSEWQSRFCTSQDSWDELDGANHTFSSRDWREWVECQTVDFVMSIDATY